MRDRYIPGTLENSAQHLTAIYVDVVNKIDSQSNEIYKWYQ